MSVRELFYNNDYTLKCKELTIDSLNVTGNLDVNGTISTSSSDGFIVSGSATSFSSGIKIANTSGTLPSYQLVEGGTENATVGCGIGVLGLYDSTNMMCGFKYSASDKQVGVNFTTASTSSNTGALVISGGSGVAGNLNVGGVICGNVTTSTFATTLSGAWTEPLASKTVEISKIGNIVFLQYPEETSGTVDGTPASWSFVTPIPAGFYNPTHSVNCPIEIQNGGVGAMGSVKIGTDGSWNMYAHATLTGVSGTYVGGFTISYLI